MDQKPSIGRIVHFINTYGDAQAAIVTCVHSDTCVNLRVFGDNGEVPSHETSVSLGEGRGDWRWPPRV